LIKYSKLVFVTGLLAGISALGGCALPSSTETPSTGFDWSFIIIVAIFGLAIYFLMIRPQRNNQKKQQKLLSELAPGDKVITAGGIYGEIESLDEQSAVLKIESGAKIRVARSAIAGKRTVQS
jgi:preprotein translocase subunit YajC